VLLQVRNLVKPIASLKKLQVLLILAPDLPGFVIGDDKQLMQTALNVVGNAVKFMKKAASQSIKVSLERAEYLMDPLMPEFYPVQGEQHCYIRVEVSIVSCSFFLGSSCLYASLIQPA
jgi:ethylene receptor